MNDASIADMNEVPATAGEPLLTFEEARVLGCLLEKEVTTPDYYPMTLNGLSTACNQKSNRSPVVEWDDRTVEDALGELRRKRLAVMISMAGARVPKYKHTVGEVLDRLSAGTRAILTELLVRGRQTLGELRTNTERLYAFPDLVRIEEAVQELINYPTGPILVCLPPGGNRKAKTYMHLLCGRVEADTPAIAAAPSLPSPDWRREMEERLSALTKRVEALEAFLGELKS